MRKKVIKVKPLVSPNIKFMGFEKYGMVLFDNCFHKEQLGYKYVNGIKRYITGLDEFSQEITSITDERKRKEMIEYIRNEVALLEMQLVFNKIDPKDPNFWNKVKKLLPTNDEFWKNIVIKIDNNGLSLDIENNPEHRILFHCIRAGGFSSIAPSYSHAIANSTKYLFYLDNPDDVMLSNQNERKLRNKAISILETLESEQQKNKMYYLAKIVLPSRVEITYNHSVPELYNMLDSYINSISDNNLLLNDFINYTKKRENELQIYAMLNDMISMKKLYYKDNENQYFCVYTQSFLGRDLEDCVIYLLSPVNRITLQSIFTQYRADLSEHGVLNEVELVDNIEVQNNANKTEKTEDNSIKEKIEFVDNDDDNDDLFMKDSQKGKRK